MFTAVSATFFLAAPPLKTWRKRTRRPSACGLRFDYRGKTATDVTHGRHATKERFSLQPLQPNVKLLQTLQKAENVSVPANGQGASCSLRPHVPPCGNRLFSVLLLPSFQMVSFQPAICGFLHCNSCPFAPQFAAFRMTFCGILRHVMPTIRKSMVYPNLSFTFAAWEQPSRLKTK